MVESSILRVPVLFFWGRVFGRCMLVHVLSCRKHQENDQSTSFLLQAAVAKQSFKASTNDLCMTFAEGPRAFTSHCF